MNPEDPLIPGSLYVVATPIGHLADLSARAASVLARVDAICAEDTRVTSGLLGQYGISQSLIALHDHNEDRIAERLVLDMRAGKTFALVSDAGTPLISDPGFALVRMARDAELNVFAIPGPSAVIAALSIAGLPTDEFTFAGFLPAKRQSRREKIGKLANLPHTWVVYESPHRIVDCAADLAEVLPAGRRVCVARELTKKFEQSVRLPVDQLPEWFNGDPNRCRGEFVLVVEGSADQEQQSVAMDAQKLLTALMSELSPSRAARLTAEITGVKRNALYEQALKLAEFDSKKDPRVDAAHASEALSTDREILSTIVKPP